MDLVETAKHKLQQLTRGGRPSLREVRGALRDSRPQPLKFKDDGSIPNNPTLPVLLYPQVIDLGGFDDPAAAFEVLFQANGWGDAWRNGIYDYVHYHSQIHEALGIARGRARVRLGGNAGKEFDLNAGDVAVLPAGTGHHGLTASEDLLVVGAYPASGTYDECRGTGDEHVRALKTIPNVALPRRDPVYGADGPLRDLWARR
jgi:uncharacterized protein YjlB